MNEHTGTDARSRFNSSLCTMALAWITATYGATYSATSRAVLRRAGTSTLGAILCALALASAGLPAGGARAADGIHPSYLNDADAARSGLRHAGTIAASERVVRGGEYRAAAPG